VSELKEISGVLIG